MRLEYGTSMDPEEGLLPLCLEFAVQHLVQIRLVLVHKAQVVHVAQGVFVEAGGIHSSCGTSWPTTGSTCSFCSGGGGGDGGNGGIAKVVFEHGENVSPRYNNPKVKSQRGTYAARGTG